MLIPHPALETLLLPLAEDTLPQSPTGRGLFIGAEDSPWLHSRALTWVCEQNFKPTAAALLRAGLSEQALAGERFPVLLWLPPRHRDQRRAELARALSRLSETGVLFTACANNQGADSLQRDLERLLGTVQGRSKHKCRLLWSLPGERRIDAALLAAWLALGAPKMILQGKYWSRPGAFSWDRIDPGSALLAAQLPSDLAGAGADLGAGWGYLSVQVFSRCPAVQSLDLFEADRSALELAELNLAAALGDQVERRPSFALHWQDVSAGLAGHYDFIISNPPFHLGHAAQPALGEAFIRSAAEALRPGGQFWMVANRHLPYEACLDGHFQHCRRVIDAHGFKVFAAVK
jgi:16S rRNA (guanine1207-N2)-methyltransferase